jgi:signal transduction histidine kinase/CheY-like chemotaxis protein/HPt (histidine-containing phosphotransfer) domain-containing protein
MKDFQVDVIPNPAIVYDSDWRIRQINKPALTLLGYSNSEELYGKSIHHILATKKYRNSDDLQLLIEDTNQQTTGKEIEHLGNEGKSITLFVQFKKMIDTENPGAVLYLESGFYCEDMLQQSIQEHQNKLDYWNILADNVPGLMVILIDKNLDVQCSIGHEENKNIVVDAEIGSKSLTGHLPPEFIAVLQPIIKIAFEGTPVSREFTYQSDYYAVKLKPLIDKRGNMLCVVVIQNITETKLVERKLVISKEEAEGANEAKSNFIAKMSHEIRTPLNAIIGFSDQLQRTRLSKKQSDYLDIVSNSSQHLLSTIDDILVLSKVESGQIEVDDKPFKVAKVLKAVEDILGHRLLKKNLEFTLHCDIPSDEVLLGDSAKLRQVLINLVNNSIKFTHRGKISLTCSTVINASRSIIIRFDVTDSGIGIPPNELETIFDPFHQVDNSMGRSYFGSGLGLTICKELVGSLGGEISAISTPGEGSTFTFTLSFKKSTEPYIEHQDKSLGDHNDVLNGVNILFVDDDPVNLLLGKVILNKYRAKVIFAKTGQEAIKRFRPGRFQLVLLDINLPGTSGIDVAKHIREKEEHVKKINPTKIIAMTANALKKHIEQYIKAGMDDVILKPYTEEKLYQKIVLHTHTREDEDLNVYKNNSYDSIGDRYSLEELLSITKGDKEFTLLMLNTFIENATNLLESIKASLYRNDYLSIAESTHRLIPSVEQLGFSNTTRLLKSIERRYLRKESFTNDPKLIEKAINEIALCIESIREARDGI